MRLARISQSFERLRAMRATKRLEGECGNPGLGAAIANAVCDALRDRGVTLTALPLTPARILAALRRAGERRAVDIARGRA